jgi:hypothetical protein
MAEFYGDFVSTIVKLIRRNKDFFEGMSIEEKYIWIKENGYKKTKKEEMRRVRDPKRWSEWLRAIRNLMRDELKIEKIKNGG